MLFSNRRDESGRPLTQTTTLRYVLYAASRPGARKCPNTKA
jgi:hypothetical protein